MLYLYCIFECLRTVGGGWGRGERRGRSGGEGDEVARRGLGGEGV